MHIDKGWVEINFKPYLKTDIVGVEKKQLSMEKCTNLEAFIILLLVNLLAESLNV